MKFIHCKDHQTSSYSEYCPIRDQSDRLH